MIYVKHRVNRREELQKTSARFGIEIDVRSSSSELFLEHDFGKMGDLFSDWVKSYKHQLLIINVKEEGLEEKINQELFSHSITNYFYLDQSIPSLYKSLNNNIPAAVRISDIEPANILENINASWIWLDNFSGKWNILMENLLKYKKLKHKLCVVSPELQKREPNLEVREILNLANEMRIPIDAVCKNHSS
jgi:hypothetical protein